MKSLKNLLANHPLLWAVLLVVGVMLYLGHYMAGMKPVKPRPPTAIDVVRVIPDSLRNFHGCPDGWLNSETMVCFQQSGWVLRMVIRCKVTGEKLTTKMVDSIPFDVDQFETVATCPGVSVVLWKPAGMAFGVREGKKWEPGVPMSETGQRIELMSRDPDKIIKLMCGVASKTTPDASDAGRPLAITPRPDEAAATSPTTPEPR